MQYPVSNRQSTDSQQSDPERLTIRLHPADVLMFRESRWFGTGAGDSQSLFPVPRTVAGAIRTYMMDAVGTNYYHIREARTLAAAKDRAGYMEDLKDLLRKKCPQQWPVDATITGPFLGEGDIRYYSAPKTFVCGHAPADSEEWTTAALRPVDNQIAACDGLRPLAANGLPNWEPLPEAWISEGNLEAYLADGARIPKWETLHRSFRDAVIADETRVGVGIASQTGTAATGLLYTSTFSRLKDDWYLEADLALPAEDGIATLKTFAEERPWLRLGGEGKVARVEIVEAHKTLSEPPAAKGKPFIYLATPALFSDGNWCPDKVSPVAAATGKPLAVSGWDLAANLPMHSRYAVPAGAVYFFDSGANVPHDTCISAEANDRENGWGYCLKGAW